MKVKNHLAYGLEGPNGFKERGGTKSIPNNPPRQKNANLLDSFGSRTGSQWLKIILIVDDELDIIFTLESVFEAYHTKFRIISYTDPLEALSSFMANFVT